MGTDFGYLFDSNITSGTANSINIVDYAFQKAGWQDVPAVDDRWNELKEMVAEWNGTSVEKLAAIELFLETH